MRILVTRPEPSATRTAEILRDSGHDPVLLPLSRIMTATPNPVPTTMGFLGLVMTSTNAITHMPVPLHRRLSELPCHVVGNRTANEAEAAGFDVRTIADETGELVRRLKSRYEPGDRLAYVCGKVRKPDLEAGLADNNIQTTAIEVYDTMQISHAPDYILTTLKGPDIEATLVYSVIAARQVKDLFISVDSARSLLKSKVYCLSDRIAKEFFSLSHLDVIVAPSPNESALLSLLER